MAFPMFLSFLGLAIVLGTITGIVWRIAEDWWERRSARLVREIEEQPDTTETVVQSTIATDPTKVN